MAGTHAILSPSAAYRWLVCTPSARFEEQLPEEESTYAAEGTLAHELAALLLSARAGVFKGPQKTFNAMLDQITTNPLYSDEMLEHCEAYVAYVLDKGGEVLIEHSYDLTKYIPLSFGTADATNLGKAVIHVTDFKYGAGVRVGATANKQMMCYGLGAYEAAAKKGFKPETVSLSIFQPRVGGPSSWDISVSDLLKWAEEEAKPKATLAIAGAGDFIPGKHCQFCKARTRCKAYYDRFADLKNIQDKRIMTAADVATVLTYGPLVSSWVKKVEEESIGKLQGNEKIPGFKLVAGRGKRSFRNEDDVVDILLGEGYESYQIFDPKLNSLTTIEKLVGPKRFKSLFEDQVVNVPGKAQIAPEDDERPAIGASAADEFDEEDLT